jgi:hypothetical protein
MANIQLGYGHSDSVGIPFDFYAGAVAVATGLTFPMQTNILVLNGAATIATATVTLPLNPVDGACAEISSTQIISGLTVNANTGDAIVNGVLAAVTALTPAASGTAGSATATIKYRYTLAGFQPASGVALNPRTWIRIQ